MFSAVGRFEDDFNGNIQRLADSIKSALADAQGDDAETDSPDEDVEKVTKMLKLRSDDEEAEAGLEEARWR